MKPYRQLFYNRQAEWHGAEDITSIRNSHEKRSVYYKWYTQGWLPKLKSAPILDIGCGAGQFIYFLKKEGYTQITGIDIDRQQVDLAQAIGLNYQSISVVDYLARNATQFALISMLDILEHFTEEELFPLLESVYARLAPGGRVIVSVPNATSPGGLATRYSDITHETCFSPTSLSQLFFCHGMQVIAFRDPWPAPVSPARKVFRSVAMFARKVETLKLKSMGLAAPNYWSPVIWAVAEKAETKRQL